MIEKLWKLVKPIVSAFIGICVANKYNFFEIFSFIPKEYVYEVCITVYFAIADVAIDGAKEFIWKCLKNKFFSEIQVVIYQINTEPNIKSNPTLIFNSEDQAEACISISVKGHKKHFKDAMLQIKNPAFADIQGNYRRNEVSVDNDTYAIHLERLFGGNDKSKFTQMFRIVLAQMPVDDECIAEIKPEILNKRINVVYKHNYAELKARRG